MTKKLIIKLSPYIFSLFVGTNAGFAQNTRTISDFDDNWTFYPGDVSNAQDPEFNDANWRKLNLPHDWSIEGVFNKNNPAGISGGALPGGIGWYRKTFGVSDSKKDKLFFIDFDGVYRNSEVWINGHLLGTRPYGYSSFRYEITPYLQFGGAKNVISVKVDNSQQPNSRWYSGSGIYRNVWLVTTDSVHIAHWGTNVTTSQVNAATAKVTIVTTIDNKSTLDQNVTLNTYLYDQSGTVTASVSSKEVISHNSTYSISKDINVNNPYLWSIDTPYLYKAVSIIEYNGITHDSCTTTFGIRSFKFESVNGFSINGKSVKIKGVCNHHDLGCLGAAINKRGIERQLEILKKMGCNGIRTSHNPPAPELLDLCDKMGFIVLDEAFDMWDQGKTTYDYSLNWATWHKTDLQDMILRDRNHPSVFIWSIGNEIWSMNNTIALELSNIIKGLDLTRPITMALNTTDYHNQIFSSGALDLVGINYNIENDTNFLINYPGKKFIGTETTSALATRGSYDMPSDSLRIWPKQWDIPIVGNADHSCSSYDNCMAGWGSTHEENWKIIKKFKFLSGMFGWTGFDYLGEPTPYDWPSRSSYFGIIDLAGFPKDVYYMYQSEWTNEPVLHIFPHWNWTKGQTIDVWAYSNCQNVELFLNDSSLGVKSRQGDDLHTVWHVKYKPGTLKAIARNNDTDILIREIKTAGTAAKVILNADRGMIDADGKDLSFVTATIVDSSGTMVPNSDNLVNFTISGNGVIAGVDNGSQTSLESFKDNKRKAFHGMCLAVIQSGTGSGDVTLTANSVNLIPSSIVVKTKNITTSSDTTIIPVFVKNLTQNQITVYPNPLKDRFVIDFGEDNFSRFDIINLPGNIVYSKNINSNQKTIEVIVQLHPGIYFLNLTGKNTRVSKKLIIQ